MPNVPSTPDSPAVDGEGGLSVTHDLSFWSLIANASLIVQLIMLALGAGFAGFVVGDR
jgi:hypothetical protein